MNIKILHTKRLRWVDVTNSGEEELRYLSQHFALPDLAIEDIRRNQEHPKLLAYPEGVYLALLFPFYHAEKREITPVEVDFFITDEALITIHDGTIPEVDRAFQLLYDKDEKRREVMPGPTGQLLCWLLDRLLHRTFPLLDQISADIRRIENRLFDDYSLPMLGEIARMRRNITEARKILKTHRFIMLRLANTDALPLRFHGSRAVHQELIDDAENIWDLLTVFKETLDAHQETNLALSSQQLAHTTRIVTVLSAIALPATLVAFLFGIGVRHIPFANHPHGFWIVALLMTLASLVTLLVFKIKKWF